jgi:predicted transcriptional regulator of viral defense system
MFGVVEPWATKTERVRVSDLERTAIDGLKQPEHCGGLTEVAKGFWMRRDAIAAPKLVDYALRLGVGAVVRRLGFLLETFEIDAPAEIERLRPALTATYAPLDPVMPAEGPWQARWRVRVNVEPDELRALGKT